MKYWLIFMIFSDDGGEYLRKKEIPTASREACEREAGRQARRMVNKGYLTQSWCVSDNHYRGRRYDRGTPPYLNIRFNF